MTDYNTAQMEIHKKLGEARSKMSGAFHGLDCNVRGAVLDVKEALSMLEALEFKIQHDKLREENRVVCGLVRP